MDRRTAAEAHAYHICFYDRIDPPREEELCEELSLALRAMRETEELPLLVMGHTNPKAPEFVCVLAEQPSVEALARARQVCEGNSNIRVLDHCIVCMSHWSEITWGDPLPIPPPTPEPSRPGLIKLALAWLLLFSPLIAVFWLARYFD